MSPLGITSSLFSLFQSGSKPDNGKPLTDIAFLPSGSNFNSALALRLATLQAQSVTSLLEPAANDNQQFFNLDFLSGSKAGSTSFSASGRNLDLYDPESAYRMMTVINNRDVNYRAQYSELDKMGETIGVMQQAGKTLAETGADLSNEALAGKLQAFTDRYNEWITRFDATVRPDGILSGTQAAEVSLHELEQSVENVFNGARYGFHGLRDLGITIDADSNLASFDLNRLKSSLEKDKDGAIATIKEFGANFARSAELLNSANNFIPNRLDNLDRVIDFISDNKASLQAEFGLGDPARPSAQIARALAAYNQIYSR